MRLAIAQSGPENSGKTSTIRLMYDRLLDAHPDATTDYFLDNKNDDLRAVVTIGDMKVGIESLGDPWKKQARLEPSLALFLRLGCEVIITAARTFGGTLDCVRDLEDDGYTVIVRSRTREVQPELQQKRNQAEAIWMCEQVEEQIGAALA